VPPEEPTDRVQLLAEIRALRRQLARERMLLLVVTAIALVAVATHFPSPW
jgi:hypothetical protein